MSTNGFGRWWGPVFEAERVTRARRWQGYALRSLFVLALLLGLVLVGRQATARIGVVTVRELASIGGSLASILIILELVAALLIAPATTAGAICLDRGRGSLAHLFVTDLTDREIILGKLAARLLPTWGLLACAFPVAALAIMLGGIDPVALAGAFLVILSVAFLGCTFALMLSVWAGKPHEVISAVYAAWALWLLDWPVFEIITGAGRAPAAIEWTHPFFLALGHQNHPGESFTVPTLLFSLACLGAGSICTAVAIRRVRVVARRSPRVRARAPGSLRRAFARLAARVPRRRGPGLDANPVLWREWHRNRPPAWSRRIWLGFEGISAVTGVYLIAEAVTTPPTGSSEAPSLLLAGLAVFGLLLIAAAVAGVLAEERAQGSLDVLLAAPVSTRTILGAKWRGAYRRVPRLVFWPAAVGLVYAVARPTSGSALGIFLAVPTLILAQGAALVSLGLALATWIRRPGQATAWTVAALVGSVVGWIILGVACRPAMTIAVAPEDRFQLGRVVREYFLFMGSPFWNVGMPLSLATRGSGPSGEQPGVLTLMIAWTIFYAAAAWGLFELTARTFDRCLGRAPERPRRPRVEPARSRTGQRLGLENS